MNRSALKDVLYGGVEEMLSNPQYYYNSSIGPGYSHWTDEGAKNIAEFMNLMAAEIARCRVAEDEQRSKNMVMKELKKT